MRKFTWLAVLLFVLASFFVSYLPAKAVIPDTAQITWQYKYAIGDEIPSLRTENSKTFYAGTAIINGKEYPKYRAVFHMGAIHYKDNYKNSAEAWKDINLTIVNNQITKAPYTLTINPDNYSISIYDKKTGSTANATLIGVGKDSKAVTKKNALQSKGKLSWADVATDLDLAIEADNTHIRFKRILKSNKAPTEALFAVTQSGNGIILTSGARYPDGSGEVPVTATKGTGSLLETIDKAKITKYPVEIDPTWQVGASTDDTLVYWTGAAWAIDNANAIYAVGYGAATAQKDGGGMRFQNVTIPNPASITTAKLTFHARASNALNNVNSVIIGEDTDDAATFSTLANYKGRRGTIVGGADDTHITTASVNWNAIGAWVINTNYDSPDISTVVQEIVNRAGWASGNDMVIFWDDHAGNSTAVNATYRRAESWDGDAANAPILDVTYVSLATVTCQAATNIEETTVTMNGNITATGGGNADDRGFVWWDSFFIDPGNVAPGGFGWHSHDPGSWGIGAYSDNAGSLTPGTTYVYSAWVHNAAGYSYSGGSSQRFLTKPNEPTGFTATQGTISGQIDLAWTAGTGTQKTMVRFRTDGVYPTDPANGTQAYFGAGSSYSHTGLTGGTTYHYRIWSYAESTFGAPLLTYYSDLYDEDNELAIVYPTVTSAAATNVEETTATTNGNITATGGQNADHRGVVYDLATHADPGNVAPGASGYAGNVDEAGAFGVAAFSENITPLVRGQEYFYRMYAHNQVGYDYSNVEQALMTKPDEPNTFVAVAVSCSQIDLSWVKGTGAQNTYIRGLIGAYPNIGTGVLVYNNTGITYSHTVGANEHWYYRAWSYATEGGLSQYSDLYDQDNDTSWIPPTIDTQACTGFSTDWATVSENVTTVGLPITGTMLVGFEYGLDTSYGATYTDNVATAIGAHSVTLLGLLPATTYHYRAIVTADCTGTGADATFTTMGSPSPFASYTVADTGEYTIYGTNFGAQIFKSPAQYGYTVTSVKLLCYRLGNPGTVTVSIKRASPQAAATGDPTGDYLMTCVVAGATINTTQTWFDFPMTATTMGTISLEPNTYYAIQCEAGSGDAANYVRWRRVTVGTYADGSADISTDSGLTWTNQAWDFNFQVWGYASMQIEDAKVFQSYKQDGDWLIPIRYINTMAPYYDSYDVRKFFVLQLLDTSGNIKAETIVPAWGNRPGSIYLSAAAVTSLQWGANYHVRLYGKYTGTPYIEYVLQAKDWLGSDLSQLDSWVIASAKAIGEYDNADYTTYIAGKGEVLTNAGAALFDKGITGLSVLRPDIFQIQTQTPTYTPSTISQTYRQSTQDWRTNIGPDGTVMLERVGNIIGVGGNVIVILAFFIMTVVLAVLAFPAGHTTAAFILSVMSLAGAAFWGLDIIYILALALIAAFLFVKKFWMDTGQ